MKSILVPVDFTEHTADAARYAAAMAAEIGADVLLIYVWRLPNVNANGPISDDVIEEIRNSCLSSLDTLANELIQRTGGKVHVTTHLETGDIQTGIKSFCEWKKPFLIVTGQLHMPMQHRLPFPVLAIPPHAVFHPIRSIVLACDHEDLSTGIPIPIDFFQQVCDLLGAQFQLLHVSIKEEKDEKMAIAAFLQWKDKLAAGFPEMHFTHAASVEEGIFNYLHDHTADWLIVFPKKTGLFRFHKNLSSEIILHCPLPTMSMTS